MKAFSCSVRFSVLSLLPLSLHFPPPPCFDCAFNTLYVCPLFSFPSQHEPRIYLISNMGLETTFLFVSTCEIACDCECVGHLSFLFLKEYCDVLKLKDVFFIVHI